MSNVRRYLANAQRMANESFSNADGFIDDDLSFTGEDFFSANGVGGGSAPTSQPYIVTVTSTSGSAVSDAPPQLTEIQRPFSWSSLSAW